MADGFSIHLRIQAETAVQYPLPFLNCLCLTNGMERNGQRALPCPSRGLREHTNGTLHVRNGAEVYPSRFESLPHTHAAVYLRNTAAGCC